MLKRNFVATKDVLCRDKNKHVCRDKTNKHTLVATKDVFCHDKPVFVTIKHDKTFVATKMIFVAAPANDKTQHYTDRQRQTDFCIKMDSGESHFNVLVTRGRGAGGGGGGGNVTKTMFTDHNF